MFAFVSTEKIIEKKKKSRAVKLRGCTLVQLSLHFTVDLFKKANFEKFKRII